MGFSLQCSCGELRVTFSRFRAVCRKDGRILFPTVKICILNMASFSPLPEVVILIRIFV
jgi:hypothetical protein